MATCHRCGQVNRPGSINCATCGAPLAQPANVAMVGADDGLPDWLRQLQPVPPQEAPQSFSHGGYAAQQQPSPAPMFGTPPQQFSAGSLINDDALPNWLRAAGQLGALPTSQPASTSEAWNTGTAAANGYTQGMPGQAQSTQGLGYGSAEPTPRTSGPLGYNQPASGLFDESALPDWLREASQGPAADPRQHSQGPYVQSPAAPYGTGIGSPPAAANGYPGYGMPPQQAGQSQQLFGQPPAPAVPASSAFPSIDQVGLHQPPQPTQAGLSGRALLDTGALPPWLGGRTGTTEQSGGMGTTGSSSGMAAQSLIDESALPQWLRAEPNSPAAPAPSAGPSPTVSSRIAGSASAEPLPAWLNQVYADANVARIEPQSTPPAWGMYPPAAVPAPAAAPRPLAGTSAGTGISASDFVDESALPDWLRSQGAMESPPAVPPAAPPTAPFGSMQPDEWDAPRYMPATENWGAQASVAGSGLLPAQQPAAQQPPSHFAASDLIDPSAVPAWVRGGEALAEPSFSSTTGWTSRQPAAPASSMPQSNAPQQLPEWSAANEWEGGVGPGSGALSPQPFGDGDEQWYSGQVASADDGASDWFQSGTHAAPRDQVLPEPNSRWPAQRFGERAPNSDRRRGPPIPSDQLPPWLQRGGPMQGAPAGRGGDFAVRGGYGPDQGGYPTGPADGYDAGDWGANPQGDEDWSNWDQGQYGGAGYRAGYGGYPPPEAVRQGQQRGGWRRLFGRK